ncbi:prephenate dehydrogenase [Limimonas halophila]|uniref:prephenate dehydrogenase n=1 Tax=Limimonas halophila TaxID=1082479 RepID=A0A1G7TRU0_9PROT|nr:prephenate/arogenate dehydrogenase family protein [Limimonas halophila]SDG38026.1 prephenate dehydrogenase [Limimonas halophila]
MSGQRVANRLAILGIGLIGSSLALAARRHGLVGEIVGCARSPETRRTALDLGIVDAATGDPAEAAADADIVVFATPLSAYPALAEAVSPVLKAESIVTDVGSVKQSVIRDIGPFVPDHVHFVPGHPVAGTEKSGPEAGFAELFEDRWTILTPPPGTDRDAIARITALWQGVGAMVEEMDPRHHDRVLGITSHLPHLIAYTIVSTASDLEGDERQEVIKFAAGGFRDFTRIAGSDPVMWRDIFLNNRDAVLEILQRFNEDITALQRAIRWGEGEVLAERFDRARQIRRGVIEAHQAGSFDPREPEKAAPAASDPQAPSRSGNEGER